MILSLRCVHCRRLFGPHHTDQRSPCSKSAACFRGDFVIGTGGGGFDLRFNLSRRARCAFRPAVGPLAVGFSMSTQECRAFVPNRLFIPSALVAATNSRATGAVNLIG